MVPVTEQEGHWSQQPLASVAESTDMRVLVQSSQRPWEGNTRVVSIFQKGKVSHREGELQTAKLASDPMLGAGVHTVFWERC